ncbi:MAG: S-methyl-5'-thioadenosine phosphorylase, partial [bacterium]|nr:S-methyl-5'-thioadenosine phosphorylase [bacterium]
MINYRANIAAMKQLGVGYILATTAVGSINKLLAPGTLVLSDQILDFTRTRASTFFEGGERGVTHVDFTYPYCPSLRKAVLTASSICFVPVTDGGSYVCFEGPRYESAGEIKMFALLGGDVVGMTAMPEAALAREAEICYVGISMVTNYAAGLSTSPLSHYEVLECMAQNSLSIVKLLTQAIEVIDNESVCSCHSAASK